MLIEDKLEQKGQQGQGDLFCVAPPPETPATETSDPAGIPPAVSAHETDTPKPVITNPVSSEKRPLVFSDGDPLPVRKMDQSVLPQEKSGIFRPKHQAIHLDPTSFPQDAGFGILLAEARRLAGMTEEQVIRKTKLSSLYLRALEQSDLKKLPPLVYVAAYVDTLGKLYSLDDESMSMLLARFNAEPNENDVPPALIQTLEKDRLVNEEEEKRISKFFWAAISLFVLFIAIIVWIVIAVTCHSSSGTAAESAAAEKPAIMEEPAGKPSFSREDFDALRVPQVPEASTLQMSRKRCIAK